MMTQVIRVSWCVCTHQVPYAKRTMYAVNPLIFEGFKGLNLLAHAMTKLPRSSSCCVEILLWRCCRRSLSIMWLVRQCSIYFVLTMVLFPALLFDYPGKLGSLYKTLVHRQCYLNCRVRMVKFASAVKIPWVICFTTKFSLPTSHGLARCHGSHWLKCDDSGDSVLVNRAD